MKILIIHASAGAGHMKAAEAVYNGFKNHTEHQAVLVDALDHTSPFFKHLYRSTYKSMITYVPTVWAGMFALLDIPLLQSMIRMGRRIYNGINAKKLERLMIDEKFDYIISCHFMPTEISARLKRQGKIQSQLITVVTDYEVHRIWLADGIDQYAVASDWTKQMIVKMGIEEKRVVVSGIPTDERFSKHPDIGALRDQLGIRRDDFTVLIATGSFGIGPIEKIAEKLEGFQVLVVTGHNQGLFDRLTKKNYPHVKPLPLVDNMFEWMAASDVMVTKPGGLSITEAMVTQVPMIFFAPIPGQETNNIKVLSQYGVGYVGGTVKRIVAKLQEWRDSRDAYLTMLRRTSELARPGAVQTIIDLIK